MIFIKHLYDKKISGAVSLKTAPLLAFRPLNLYRTHVRLRVLKDEIYLRQSASVTA